MCMIVQHITYFLDGLLLRRGRKYIFEARTSFDGGRKVVIFQIVVMANWFVRSNFSYFSSFEKFIRYYYTHSHDLIVCPRNGYKVKFHDFVEYLRFCGIR